MSSSKIPAAYVCPTCGRESWNPNDAANNYCGVCGFQDGSLPKSVRCDGYHWAVVGPGDAQPEMFFANEQWARDCVAAAYVEAPDVFRLVRIFRVKVSYELVPQGGGKS